MPDTLLQRYNDETNALVSSGRGNLKRPHAETDGPAEACPAEPKKSKPSPSPIQLLMVSSPFAMQFGDESAWHPSSLGIVNSANTLDSIETPHDADDLGLQPLDLGEVWTWIPQVHLAAGVDRVVEYTRNKIIHPETDRSAFDTRWVRKELNLSVNGSLGVLVDYLLGGGLSTTQRIPPYGDARTTLMQSVFSDRQKAKWKQLPTGDLIHRPITLSSVAAAVLGPRAAYRRSRKAMLKKGLDVRICHDRSTATHSSSVTEHPQTVYRVSDLTYDATSSELHMTLAKTPWAATHLPHLPGDTKSSTESTPSLRPMFVSVEANANHNFAIRTPCKNTSEWWPIGKRISATDPTIQFHHTPAVLDTPAITAKDSSCLKQCMSFSFYDWAYMDILIPVGDGRYAVVNTRFISMTTLSALFLVLRNHILDVRALQGVLYIAPELFWNTFLRWPGLFCPERRDRNNRTRLTSVPMSLAWRRAVAMVMQEILIHQNPAMITANNTYLHEIKSRLHQEYPVISEPPLFGRFRLQAHPEREDMIQRCINTVGRHWAAFMPKNDSLRAPIWNYVCNIWDWAFRTLDVHYLENVGRTICTRVPIPDGGAVVEYVGELVTNPLSIRIREAAYGGLSQIHCASYLFYIDGSNALGVDVTMKDEKKSTPMLIDASAESLALGRLVNHSRRLYTCIPKVFCDCECGLPKMAFIAKRALHSGEEVRIDYGDTSKLSQKSNPWLKQ